MVDEVPAEGAPAPEALAARLRHGDEAAADLLYRRLRPILFDLVARILGNLEEAENVTQDALLRTLDVARRRELRSVRAFALRVARNQAFDVLRHRALVVEREDPEEALVVEPELEGVDLERLRHAVEELPERYRTIVRLRWEDGLSFSEIAEALSMSKNGVHARHHKALELIRKAFSRPRRR